MIQFVRMVNVCKTSQDSQILRHQEIMSCVTSYRYAINLLLTKELINF